MQTKRKTREVARHRRELGKRIEAAREAKELTLTEFAREVGVEPPTAWGWENGRYSPGLVNLRKIAAVVGKSVDELIGEAA